MILQLWGENSDLRAWWDASGPSYGYFANAFKITKKNHHANAITTFADTEVNVTAEGRPHLGAAIGSQNFRC